VKPRDRGGGAGRNRLLVLEPWLAQVHMDVDESGSDNETVASKMSASLSSMRSAMRATLPSTIRTLSPRQVAGSGLQPVRA